MDIPFVLTKAYPGTFWSHLGEPDDYSGLTWMDDSPMPTEQELAAAWPQARYDFAYAQVEQARHAAYITDADPLFFKWQRGTGTEQEWLDAVQAVKDAHPYPDAP